MPVAIDSFTGEPVRQFATKAARDFALGFPPHDPDFPDVNPATGDERETTGLGENGDPLP